NRQFNFVNPLNRLYLDVAGASQVPGIQLDQWPSNGGANQQFALVQDAPPTAVPDFTISATPNSRSIACGSGTTYTATIAATNGFSGTVTFSASGLPTGTSGGLAHSTSVTLGVTDFSVAVSPASRTITAGSNTTYTLTVSALNGFSGTVTFGAVSGLPAGASASFSPGSVSGSGTSTLT